MRLKAGERKNSEQNKAQGANEPNIEQGVNAAQAEAASASHTSHWSKWLQGAAILGAAALISKLLGTLQKIPFQNLAGDAAFGIYNAVYPIYMLLMFAAVAGFPVVVSKFTAECAARGRMDQAAEVLHAASRMMLLAGAAGFLGLFLGADTVASWMAVPEAAPAIRSISFALLIVPYMSVLRGFDQGCQNMTSSAWSQVMEQVVRVAVMFILLIGLLRHHAGYEMLAAGATFGSTAGAAAGLIVMLYYRKARMEALGFPVSTKAKGWNWPLYRRIAVFAVPVLLASVATPVINAVDSFTVPRLLRASGLSGEEALYQFGLYHHGQPLVQLVTMTTASLCAAIVPAIAEAVSQGDHGAVRERAGMFMKVIGLVGMAASAGLVLLAEPLNVMFFDTAEGTPAMRILALTAVLSAVYIAAASVLQGVGAVKAPALYLLLGAAVKIAAVQLLVPRYGIDGAAWAAVAAFACAGTLALAHALRASGASPAGGLAAGMKPMLAIGFMLAAASAAGALPQLLPALAPRAAASASVLAAVAAGALAYALALGALGVVTAAELARVPQLAKLAARLRRLRLLR